jgi:ABC-type lipopolysaccharide export system ATPase subunit
MLLDEPFAGIDPLAVADLKNTIIKLNEKKIGVLISDHNVRDTMNICSKVIVVNKGKIIANGKPDEIAKDSLVKEVYLGQNFLN